MNRRITKELLRHSIFIIRYSAVLCADMGILKSSLRGEMWRAQISNLNPKFQMD